MSADILTATFTVVIASISVGLPGILDQQDDFPPSPLVLKDSMRSVPDFPSP